MATVTVNGFTITKNVANADFTLDFDITWDSFDQLTNLPYRVTYQLIGDDTGQDQDDNAPGDDVVGPLYFYTSNQSSNGAASRNYAPTWSLAWATLNEDGGAAGLNDDEIRVKVTVEPQLPVTVSSESARVLVNAP